MLDTEKKTISMFDESKKDAFVDVLTEIQKIDIGKDKTSGDGRRNITIYKEGVEEPIVITIDKDEKIIGYKDHELSEVGNDFLRYSFGVETLDTPNIQKAGNNFCRSASIEELTLPKLETAGDNFCASADNLKRADLSSLTEVGDNCLATINSLEELSLPKLKKVGNKFCRRAHELKKIELPELIEAGDESLEYTRKLKKLEAPKLQSVGNEFCCFTGLESIRLQSLETVGDLFCQCCQEVRTVDLPQVKTVGDQFMEAVENVESVRMPNLSKAGDAFLLDAADTITEFEAPKISRLKWFFSQNKHMVSVINRTKKIQKIKKTDIVVLDASKMLMPEEIEEAKTLVEEPTVEVNRDNIRRTEEI